MSTQPEDKKKAVNYYQGITVSGSPIYYGKRFPSWREFIPLFAGINSHNIKNTFPQYVGLPELTDILTQDHSILYIRQIEAFL